MSLESFLERSSVDFVSVSTRFLSVPRLVVVRLLGDLFGRLTRFVTDVVGFGFVTEGEGMVDEQS